MKKEIWIKPPAAARLVAREALDARFDLPPSRRGGTAIGLARAYSIMRGELQPARRIYSFFTRFRGTFEDAVFQGKTWERSKVIQAWDLWGGEPMREAVERAVADG